MFEIVDIKNLGLVVNELNKLTIEGLYLKDLQVNTDGRGSLTELWSQPWGEQESVEKEVKHVYWNVTHHGVIKAWHYHKETVSQYTCVQGKMQIVLVDCRSSSPTLGQVNQFLIGTHKPSLIRIPPGVLKGWKSLAGDSVIVNLLNNADINDNFKLKWDEIPGDIWQTKMG